MARLEDEKGALIPHGTREQETVALGVSFKFPWKFGTSRFQTVCPKEMTDGLLSPFPQHQGKSEMI